MRAYDSRGGFATQAFDITVDGGNNAPLILDMPPMFTLNEGLAFQVGVNAYDQDGQVIAVSMDNLPAGAVFDPAAMRLSWTRDEVDGRLLQIMQGIHAACVQHGTRADGSVSYIDGANVAGFVKVADAMLAQGVI